MHFVRAEFLTKLKLMRGQYDTTEEIFWASGAAMVVRTDLFNQIGGFDNTYFAHYEEIDLCWRMKRAGYKVMAEFKCSLSSWWWNFTLRKLKESVS